MQEAAVIFSQPADVSRFFFFCVFAGVTIANKVKDTFPAAKRGTLGIRRPPVEQPPLMECLPYLKKEREEDGGKEEEDFNHKQRIKQTTWPCWKRRAAIS
uniref:Uncharacterized protein n=1 Tax=Ditylenchus dipsaci TaxID=166011 RepID=A0A915E9V2_9BILA